MNLSEILRKIPKDKLYKNTQIKKTLSKTEKDIVEKLNKMLEEKRSDVFAEIQEKA